MWKVGMLVRNVRYNGRGKPHAVQELVSFNVAKDTAVVKRINTNGMTANVKLSNLEVAS